MANQIKPYKVAVTLHAYTGKKISVAVEVPHQIPVTTVTEKVVMLDATIRNAMEEVLFAVGAYKVSEIDRIDICLDTDRI